jgi:hypothetical protein
MSEIYLPTLLYVQANQGHTVRSVSPQRERPEAPWLRSSLWCTRLSLLQPSDREAREDTRPAFRSLAPGKIVQTLFTWA